MRIHGTLRTFPDIMQITRLSSSPAQWTNDHLAAVLEEDPVERDRALLSLLLNADQPSWVRISTSTPDPHRRVGGRRNMMLEWSVELELVADIEAMAQAGEPVTPLLIAQMMSQRAGRPVARYTIYRLLRRHGWVSTRRTHRKARS